MALNPVERRLVDLRDYWEAFRTDRSKRLLVWKIPDNGLRLLGCFFEAQKYDAPYATGDLFIVFDAAFEHSIQYSRALKEALAGQYEASQDDLDRQGIKPDWRFTPAQLPDSANGFVQSLRSFGSHYHTSIGHLVAVLLPPSVADDQAFIAWILRALGAGLPERLRLVVADSLEHPRLEELTTSPKELVFVDSTKIDAMTVAQETFAEEGAVGPAAVFRNFLIGIVTLIEKGSADQVKAKAADAVAFARKQQWADQEVAIAMLVAGALLKEKRFDEAIETYRSARQPALSAAGTGHPAGQQLMLQTWFGEAGAHLAAGRAAPAAECYDQAAGVAQRIPNAILAIEAFRMGAFCNARLEQREAAFERGSLALSIGSRLKPEARAMTTLPLAAVDLLRVVELDRVKRMEEVKHRLDARIDRARAGIEQHAADLEQVADPKQLRAAEADLAQETARAQQEAARELDAVAASGTQQFRQVFSRARDLLGQDWPLASPSALPRAPEPAAGADASGVVAA